ncbi:MAG TPA: DUF2911 domain-containing protein [Bryobacteraceae bacterium]|nr:DUF2911 domain-containing protein [Bryobacteraceae bacterium]
MTSLLRTLLPFTIAGALFAQFPGLTLPPSGNNQRASVTQYIGPVRVNIEYSSPAVHTASGLDRRGKIWGGLVPYGMTNLGLNGGKLSPWRAGANENTVFAVSEPVTIEGQPLPAGRYGLHMIPGQDEWTIIFSKNAHAWGSFFYDEADDALRVKVKPAKHEYREYLTYEFSARRPAQTTAELQWEELSVPWTIKVDNVNDVYVTRLRRELTGENAFDYRAYDAAAQYLVQAGTQLDQALKWADAAISAPFIGQANFDTLSTKALVLGKMDRTDEAKATMQTALKLPGTSPTQIHQYGRSLLNAKKNQEAMEIFKYNFDRNGDAWPVHVGLARGYAALGDTKQALEHAQKALPQAPDELNRQGLQTMIKTLSEGQTKIN